MVRSISVLLVGGVFWAGAWAGQARRRTAS